MQPTIKRRAFSSIRRLYVIYTYNNINIRNEELFKVIEIPKSVLRASSAICIVERVACYMDWAIRKCRAHVGPVKTAW